MSDTSDSLDIIVRVLEDRRFYAVLTLSVLMFFIINPSPLGLSESMLTAYGFMAVMAFIMLGGLDGLGWKAQAPSERFAVPLKAHWVLAIWITIFSITFILVYAWQRLWDVVPEAMEPAAKWGTMWQQLLIVTLTETVVFQGAIPLTLAKLGLNADKLGHAVVLFLVSQGGFAIAHWGVYHADWRSMLAVFFLGSVWLWLARKFGLSAAWGSHFAYNILVLGAIAGAPTTAAIIQLIGGF